MDVPSCAFVSGVLGLWLVSLGVGRLMLAFWGLGVLFAVTSVHSVSCEVIVRGGLMEAHELGLLFPPL